MACSIPLLSKANRGLFVNRKKRASLSASELATELNVSVKTIETHQMRIKEKLALHSVAELRQKARDWLARWVVNRVYEDAEPA